MSQPAFQDEIGSNYCWGCGSLNPLGLQIKSYWSGEESVCDWQPDARYMGGPQHILNGGIIATLIDCHCVCTAIADAYRMENRAINSDPFIWYATVALNVSYLQPTPITAPVRLSAQVTNRTDKKTVLTCTLISAGQSCAFGEVVAVRVPSNWFMAA
jgi:acyl-coenzyme A thioesterase PaaI-like protein